MRLRPPQRTACRAAADLLPNGPVLISSPTGTGKTVMGCALAEAAVMRHAAPVLWVAPTDETLRQAAERFVAAGWVVQIDKADEWSQPIIAKAEAKAGARVVIVASQGTLRMKRRLERYSREGWALCVLDECHHSPASTWLGVREYFCAPWLGLTATTQPPGLADLWTEVKAFQGGIMQAISDGWLVPVTDYIRYVEMEKEEYQAMRSADLAEVADAVVRPIRSMAEVMGDRQGLTFWPRTLAAAQAAKFMVSPELDGAPAVPGLPWKARMLSGKMPRAERSLAIRQYHAKTLQVLSLCGVGIEGMDIPDASVLGIWRQTESEVMLSQMIGRVMRPLAGVLDGLDDATAEERREAIARSAKPHATVVSVASPDMHEKWATPGRLFFGDLPEPVLIDMEARARQGGKSIAQALQEAKEAEAERQRVREQRQREHEERLARNAHWRAEQLAQAKPYEMRSAAQVDGDKRRDWATARWLAWSERAQAAPQDADRASDDQARAIERMIHRYLGKPAPPPNGAKVAQLVRGWDKATAKSAQYALLKRLG